MSLEAIREIQSVEEAGARFLWAGTRRLLEADTVVLAAGLRPENGACGRL